jgi:hypothetical protein
MSGTSQGLSRWRAETSVRAFQKWFLGDITNGGVLALNPDSRTEGGAPVVARIESAPLRNFPDRFRLGPADARHHDRAGRPDRC